MAAEPGAPRISVLVPCRDDARTLDAALASIAAQTRGDFEAVVSDDASSDDSAGIAAAWAGCDPRFRLVRSERHLGMTPNWNRALAHARGELVAKLDADDAFAPGFLATLAVELEREPAPIAAFCRTLDCDEELRPVGPYEGERALRLHGLDPETAHVRPGLEWLRLCFDDFQLWTSNAFLLSTERLRSMGGWDERWLSSDLELLLRVLGDGGPVVHSPLLGVRYRRRAGSHRHGVIERGWATAEALILPLRALGAARSRLGTGDARMRRNWWRLWSELDRLRRDSARWNSLPAELRAVYEREIPDLPRPPAAVEAEGRLRDLVSGLWRRLRSAGRIA